MLDSAKEHGYPLTLRLDDLLYNPLYDKHHQPLALLGTSRRPIV